VSTIDTGKTLTVLVEFVFIVGVLLLVFSLPRHLQADEAPSITEEETGTEEASLDEISRQLENPLTSLWSLTFQENYSIIEGDAVDGQDWTNNLFFQPALPVPVGANKDKVLIVRPVFPWVRSAYPVYDPDSSSVDAGSDTGFGDIQVFAMVGPNRTTGKVWGVGVTFKFDTASDESLGQGKNQAGPALMLINLGEKWTTGFVAQHWWSFSGDENRDETSQTDFQYIMRRRLPDGWSIGMGPTITYDWKEDSGDRLTFPIGLGITKTVRWGRTPIKLRLEPQYSIVRPDNLAVKWNIRLQITPVIKSPFMD
jgi:hypothetical protein